MPDRDESTVGTFIRRQRELQKLTMRQLADAVGISNPYLSQIERGLREPSERVLDGVAEALEVSMDKLYAQSGRRRAEDWDEQEGASAVIEAIRADEALAPRQRQAMLEVYAAFTGRRASRRDGRV